MNYSPIHFGKMSRAILLASASSLIACGFALGQQTANPTPDNTVKMEKFTVTGSLIPLTETSGEATAFPVTTFDRATIDKLSYKNAAELLQKIAFSNGGSVPISNNATATSGPLGATSISLRGLGPEATLVLINGRRVAQYPSGAGDVGGSPFVDLSSIPVAAIERIEVLKDGASSTYGADAVAGVVNIIMRRNYTGTDLFVSYGNTTKKDSSETTASLVSGAAFDKGSVTAGLNYYHRAAIFNADRSYSAVPPFLSSNSSPPNFQVTYAAAWAALGVAPGTPIAGTAANNGSGIGAANNPNLPLKATSGPSSTVPGPGNQNASNNGLLPASAYSFNSTDGNKSRFNFNEFSGSYPSSERKTAFFNGERKLFGTDNVKGYFEFSYSNNFTENQLAPLATGTFTAPLVNEIVIPSRTTNPLPLPDGRARSAPAGAFNEFNPFNIDLTGTTKARLAEFGNRILLDTVDAYSFTAGMKGEDVFGHWNFDAGFRYSQIHQASDAKLISSSRFNQILNGNDPIFNPTSSSFIGTTHPYNPFGFFRNPIPNNSLLVKYATIHNQFQAQSQLLIGNITFSTNELFSLPGGNAGAAFGYEYRTESIDQTLDGFSAGGDVLGNSPVTATIGQRKVGALFGEMSLPIFSSKNGVDFAHSLSLNIALRNEQFLTEGKNTTVPKLGVRWQPGDETLTIRASASKGYREPSLFELHAGLLPNGKTIFDPKQGALFEELSVLTRGNSKLAPETSKAFNVGAVWTPKAIKGFTASIDWWRIDRDGTVVASFQDVINREAGAVPGGLLAGEKVIRDSSGSPLQITAVFRNVGKTVVKGIDLATSYSMPTDNLGRFDFSVAGAYMYTYKRANLPGGALVELIGTDASVEKAGYDGFLKLKGRAEVNWAIHNFGTTVAANYTDGFTDVDANTGENFEVDSRTLYDVQFTYDLAPGSAAWYGSTRLTVGANNVFDRDPPFASGNGSNSVGYPAYLYNSTGRFVYVSLAKKF